MSCPSEQPLASISNGAVFDNNRLSHAEVSGKLFSPSCCYPPDSDGYGYLVKSASPQRIYGTWAVALSLKAQMWDLF